MHRTALICATSDLDWDNSFGGLSYGTYAPTSYVGDPMNDRTSSVRFY